MDINQQRYLLFNRDCAIEKNDDVQNSCGLIMTILVFNGCVRLIRVNYFLRNKLILSNTIRKIKALNNRKDFNVFR